MDIQLQVTKQVNCPEYEDYKYGVTRIEKNTTGHKNPFGRGKCVNTSLIRYCLHHEFKTDVAKIPLVATLQIILQCCR